MEPSTISIAMAAHSILKMVDWHKAWESLVGDGTRAGKEYLLRQILPNDRQKTVKKSVELFVEEFLHELEDKTPLTSAIAGYQDQIKKLIEHATPDIFEWMRPETKNVDLGPVKRIWDGLDLDPLPEGFDWQLVAQNYARAVRKHVKEDSKLRNSLAWRYRRRRLRHLNDWRAGIVASNLKLIASSSATSVIRCS